MFDFFAPTLTLQHFTVSEPQLDDIVLLLDDANIYLVDNALPTYQQLLPQIANWRDLYCFAHDAQQRFLTSYVDERLPFTQVPVKEYCLQTSVQQAQIVALANHLAYWRATHLFCGVCAHALDDMSEERARACSACGYRVYPRISPSVIVLLHDGDRLLLGRNAQFKANVYSLLAGYVEPCETPEQTVAREIWEEVRLEVDDIQYCGAQPWPFPDTLMLAYRARYAGGEIKVDQNELTDAAWFARDGLPALPRPGSIARTLIDEFFKG